MSRMTFTVETYRVELGADGDSVTNENFNIHMNIRFDPNRSDERSVLYRDWRSRNRLRIAFTNTNTRRHNASVGTWVLTNRLREDGSRVSERSNTQLEADMAPHMFKDVLATLEAATGVDIAVHDAPDGNREFGWMTLITHDKPIGGG